MKRCAVIIGVNQTTALPTLAAAASGARDVERWANTAGFDSVCLSDENGQSVTIGKIKTAIKGFVDQRIYEQMLVYFAGHGILKGPDNECWLLSEAPDDPDQSVSVSASVWHARNSGIAHLIVVSDACRSLPNTAKLTALNGGTIFPPRDAPGSRSNLDMFYATLPGDPAHEAALSEGAKYCGIFTEYFLKGLVDQPPEVVEDFGQTEDPRYVVPSWRLAPFLEREVRDRVTALSIKLHQEPEIRVESHKPRFIVRASSPRPAAARPTDTGGSPRARAFEDLRVVRFVREPAATTGALSAPSGADAAGLNQLSRELDEVRAVQGRQAFETRTGFTVLGDDIEEVFAASRVHFDVFQESGATHVRLYHGDDWTNSMVLETEGRLVIPLVILPDYIGTVQVTDGKVSSVQYTPSRGTSKYYDYETAQDEIADRRAFATVASRHGRFRFATEKEAKNAGQYLRALKSIDPILGLYAVYAYAQGGYFEEIASVYEYMSWERQPIPLDVCLLANKLTIFAHEPELAVAGGGVPARPQRTEHVYGPFCPLLTQGWPLLLSRDEFVRDTVKELSTYLVPGLWTTFNKNALPVIAQAFQNGEIA